MNSLEEKGHSLVKFGGKNAVLKRETAFSVDNQIAILTHLNHPKIPKFLDRPSSEEIIIEYIEGMDLFAMMLANDFKPLGEREAAKIMLQIVDLTMYLHSMKVAHLDFKLENIILAKNGIHFIDFGLSMFTEREPETKRFPGSMLSSAPEILLRTANYDPFIADIFSLGMVWYCLVMALVPFNQKERICHLLAHHVDPPLSFSPEPPPDATRDMIVRMGSFCPKKRPSLVEVRDTLEKIIKQE